MDTTLTNLINAIPTDLMSILKLAGLVAAGLLLLALLFRAVKGKMNDLNHALSSALAILWIYVATVLVYVFNPGDLSRFLSPLPFVSFQGDYLVLFSFRTGDIAAISQQLLSMVILAFLLNLLDTFFPKGKKLLGWFCYRVLTIVCAMALHFLLTWAFNTFLPGALAANAPTILLIILLGCLLLGVIRFLLGLVLTIANPILGAIYAFFFSSHIGKQLSKAVLTTAVLTVLALALEYMGYTAFCISAGVLMSYLPLVAVLLVLWYLIGHVL